MLLTVLIVVLNVVHVLSCVLMIVVILMQASKEGGGFGVAFGGAATETVFGSRAGNVLTKATITLASVFLVSTLLLAKVEPMRARVGLRAPSPAAETPAAGEDAALPGETAPGAGDSAAPTGETVVPAPAGASEATPSETAPAAGETSAGSETPASE